MSSVTFSSVFLFCLVLESLSHFNQNQNYAYMCNLKRKLDVEPLKFIPMNLNEKVTDRASHQIRSTTLSLQKALKQSF